MLDTCLPRAIPSVENRSLTVNRIRFFRAGRRLIARLRKIWTGCALNNFEDAVGATGDVYPLGARLPFPSGSPLRKLVEGTA